MSVINGWAGMITGHYVLLRPMANSTLTLMRWYWRWVAAVGRGWVLRARGSIYYANAVLKLQR